MHKLDSFQEVPTSLQRLHENTEALNFQTLFQIQNGTMRNVSLEFCTGDSSGIEVSTWKVSIRSMIYHPNFPLPYCYNLMPLMNWPIGCNTYTEETSWLSALTTCSKCLASYKCQQENILTKTVLPCPKTADFNTWACVAHGAGYVTRWG